MNNQAIGAPAASLIGMPAAWRRGALLLAVIGSAASAQGTYPPAAGQPGSTAIPAASASIKSWATSFTNLQRGREYKPDTLSPLTTYGTGNSALGFANAAANYPYDDPQAPAPVVSLGDGGSLTLGFSPPIANGAGADFAVFENGFSDTFLELAHVEVSSNGTNFFRFPSVSLTQTVTQIPTFGALSAVNLHNLAGKYRVGYGTPFDLEELKNVSAQLNVNRVTHVRIVDVVGSLTSGVGSLDSQWHFINDPFPTEFETGGFDLDAVGVINQYQEPPFETWRQANFSSTQLAQPAVSGPYVDPDKDGLGNFAEYALGRSPLAAGGSAPFTVAVEGAQVVVRFIRYTAHTDAKCELAQSLATSGWSVVAGNSGGGATTTSVPGASVTESTSNPIQVTVRLPKSEGRMYFRLVFTQL